MTARTPGRASAAEGSIDRIRACACGLRTVAPYNMPESCTSAPYFARPVTLSTPSWRTGRVPITLYAFLAVFDSGRDSVTLGGFPRDIALRCFRGGLDRAHDFIVAGAATQVAGQGETDRLFAGMRL